MATRTNGNGNGNKLGSGVMPIGQETGTMSNLLSMAAGWTPSWSVLDASDELESNPKLTFPTSISTYHSMRTDPQVQGLLTGATWPLLRMRWYIDPNGAKPEIVEHISADLNLPIGPDQPTALTLPGPSASGGGRGQVLNVPLGLDPSNPSPNPFPEFHQRRSQGRFNFLSHLETALDAIAYGFMMFEQVGYIGEDGLFHYKKLALRPPNTIGTIQLAKDGGIRYIKQDAISDVEIPIERLIVYPFQHRGANWHGRSLLRGCYAPWLLKDRAMRVGVMNIQRAGVGTPVAQGHPGATETDLAVLSRMAQRMVAGDRSGGAIPYGATLKMIGVEGGQPDTVGFIKLMNEEMARSFFQMFMQLGQTTSGSRALGQTFVDYHKLVIEYIAQWFTNIFNEHVIEDDIDWNWGPEEEFAPLLAWEWDTQGTASAEGPEAAQNPSKKIQELAYDDSIKVNEQTAAMIGVR